MRCRHEFHVRGVSHEEVRRESQLEVYTFWTTVVLSACACGKTRTKAIRGKWTLEQIVTLTPGAVP